MIYIPWFIEYALLLEDFSMYAYDICSIGISLFCPSDLKFYGSVISSYFLKTL